MSDEQDLHRPTAAGPEPDATEPVTPVEPVEPAETVDPVDVVEPSGPAAAEPSPVVGASEATWDRPAGSVRLEDGAGGSGSAAGAERPEVLVGAAFGGGIVAAIVLKALVRRRHR